MVRIRGMHAGARVVEGGSWLILMTKSWELSIQFKLQIRVPRLRWERPKNTGNTGSHAFHTQSTYCSSASSPCLAASPALHAYACVARQGIRTTHRLAKRMLHSFLECNANSYVDRLRR